MRDEERPLDRALTSPPASGQEQRRHQTNLRDDKPAALTSQHKLGANSGTG
jgi:hypothetical protein